MDRTRNILHNCDRYLHSPAQQECPQSIVGVGQQMSFQRLSATVRGRVRQASPTDRLVGLENTTAGVSARSGRTEPVDAREGRPLFFYTCLEGSVKYVATKSRIERIDTCIEETMFRKYPRILTAPIGARETLAQ